MFVKEYTAHARAYLRVDTAISAATVAGEAGIAPAVVATSPADGVIAFADLTGTCSTATLGDFTSTAECEPLLALRAEAANIRPGTVRRAGVFDDIRALGAELSRREVPIPDDTPLLLRILSEAESRIAAAGADMEFRHGDGNVSNVLLRHDDRALLLVDWDWAGLMDPFQDLGSVLVELADDEDQACELFEIAHGSYDSALFARSLLYGYADLVRQAFIGALTNHLDPGTFEYSKYSDWQFLRARNLLPTIRTDELLRSISA